MRAISLVLALALLLAGCATPQAPGATQPAQDLPALQLFLTLPAEADTLTQQTMQLLADETAKASGGRLLLEITQATGGALQGLEKGLALVPLEELAIAYPEFDILQQPYFFTGYNRLNLALNAPESLALMGRLAKARALAGFYMGGCYLLSTRRYYPEAKMLTQRVLLQRAQGSELFRSMEAESTTLAPFDSTLTPLLQRTATVLELSYVQLGLAQTQQERFYLLTTGHYLDCSLLLLDEETATRLDPLLLAALQEAISVALPFGDEQRLLDEEITFGGANLRETPPPTTQYDFMRQAAQQLYYNTEEAQRNPLLALR